MDFSKTRRLIEQGLSDDVFPCAAYAIGNRDRVFVSDSVGYRTLYPQKNPVTENTLFDVASLSKVVSTTMVALCAIENGKICLEDKLHYFFPNCYDKGELTIKNLVTHTSGLAASIPLYSFGIDPTEVYSTILKSPFDYKPNTQTVYSCMGYILLQGVLEAVYDDTLDELARKYVFAPLGMNNTCYKPMSQDIAATEFAKDINDYCYGIVHDENARFLGGVSGNAGVFSTLSDMVRFCTMLCCEGEGFLSHATFNMMLKNYTSGFSEDRGIGFLLLSGKPTFAGDLVSEGSYGHTGFTGGSIAIDRANGVYAILLTNRVHFGRDNDRIVRFRRQFYNTVFSSF